jgi:hypothetical protein
MKRIGEQHINFQFSRFMIIDVYMIRKIILISSFALCVFVSRGQNKPANAPASGGNIDLLMDTTLDYEDLLEEMDLFLDSLLRPRSYFMASVSGGMGYFNYITGNGLRQKVEVEKQFVLSPTIGYYYKKGPGITLSGNLTDNNGQLSLYQTAISPSFDFIQTRQWFAGVSYTRYLTKDSLSFYVSPLENEVSGYITWRKPWLQPGLSASYGWGSRTDYQKRVRYVRLLRLKRRGILVGSGTTTTEDVADFSLTGSIRHSFYRTGVIRPKDYIKFVPQLSFTAGTQKFGFNRTTSTFPVNARNSANNVYYTGDLDIEDKFSFQPISLSLYLRPEYNLGIFFFQPQLILDYYIPAENFSAMFSVTAGIML